MPCNTDHMEYGYSQGDHKYGPDLYLRSDRDELVKIIGGPMPSSASLLCFLIRKIGPEGDAFKEACVQNVALGIWWKLHDQEDSERIKREELSETVREAKRS